MSNKISVIIDVAVDKAVGSLKSFRTSIADADGIVNKFKAGSAAAFEGVKANAGALALGGATAFLKFGGDIVNAGVQMETMDAKAETVFGKSLGKIEKWAETNAAAMGLTSREAIGAGASIADLLKPMGFSEEAATQMTTGLLDLSGALSAWSGGTRSATEVSNTFVKAMLGEREELKSLGISITEAEVSARLAENGQKGLTGAVLAQAKALATQELIMEKSTDAQKAWADGSMDGVKSANEAKSSMAQLSEVMTKSLYPVMVNLVPVVAELAETLTPVAEGLAKLTSGQIGFATSFEKGTAAVNQMKTEIKAAGLDFDEWRKNVSLGKVSLDELNVAIEEGTTRVMREGIDITDKWNNGMVEGREAVEAATPAVRSLSKELRDERDAMVDAAIATGKAEVATRELDEAYQAFIGSLDQQDAFADFEVAMFNYRSTIGHSAQETRDYKRAIAETVTELDNIPEETKAKLLAELDTGSVQVVEDYLQRLGDGVNVPVRFTPTGDVIGSVGRREHGGPVQAGKPYVVGEKRAELFVPSSNGTILPSVPGGGTTTVNVMMNGIGAGGKSALYPALQMVARQADMALRAGRRPG